MKLQRRVALAVLAMAGTFSAISPAHAADVTVRMLHPDNDPQVVAVFNTAARRFEAANPGVKIDIRFLEGEAYKQKLTTLLQSSERPHLLYSWGGGVLRDQIKAGVLEDLTPDMNAGWGKRFIPSALSAYTVDGKVYGVPYQATTVGFWYNKALFAKAGIDPAGLKTWDGFVAAINKLKAAGVTPLSLGGGDKWPVHYYWAYLAMRIGGRAPFEAALRGEGKGFEDPVFVRAAAMTQQLAGLKPFQPGFLGATFTQSVGNFADGKSAMLLMVDNVPNAMAVNAADKKGFSQDQLGWLPFPAVTGGKGAVGDLMGGMTGFLLSKGAPKEARAFLKFFSEPEIQRFAAESGAYIPVVNGTQDALKNRFYKLHAANITQSKYYQTYYDQELGAKAGAVIKDLSVDLMGGRKTPEAAAAALQKSVKSR